MESNEGQGAVGEAAVPSYAPMVGDVVERALLTKSVSNPGSEIPFPITTEAEPAGLMFPKP